MTARFQNSTFHNKRVFIIGRFDAPTSHLETYVRAQCVHSTIVRVNPQPAQAMPFFQNTRWSRKHKGSDSTRLYMSPSRRSEFALVYIYQMMFGYLSLLCFFLRYFVLERSFDMVIGIGPSNGAISLLYTLRNRYAKIVYYAEDKISGTAPGLLSRCTYICDLVARKKSDAIWVLSQLYATEASKTEKNRYVFVPMPIIPYRSIKMRVLSPSIVFVGALVPEQGYDMLYRVFLRLKKQFHSLRLVIIGAAPYMERLVHIATRDGVVDAIEYKGYIADNDEILRIVSQSQIGVCLYNPNIYKNLAYGQSSKITNYITCALPVVITGNTRNKPSLADYIVSYHAGFVVRYFDNEVYTSLKSLLTNRRLYNQMKQNAGRLMRDFDAQRYYEQAFSQLFRPIGYK